MILFETFQDLKQKVMELHYEARTRMKQDRQAGKGYKINQSRGMIAIGPEPTRTPEQRECYKKYREWLHLSEPKAAWEGPIPRRIPQDRFGEGDWHWDGTKKELLKAIKQAKAQGYDKLYISEGFDGAESPADFRDSFYEPWIDEYDVLVWRYTGEDEDQWVDSTNQPEQAVKVQP